MVGVAGFEPTTSPTPRVRATRLRYTPHKTLLFVANYTFFWCALGKFLANLSTFLENTLFCGKKLLLFLADCCFILKQNLQMKTLLSCESSQWRTKRVAPHCEACFCKFAIVVSKKVQAGFAPSKQI